MKVHLDTPSLVTVFRSNNQIQIKTISQIELKRLKSHLPSGGPAGHLQAWRRGVEPGATVKQLPLASRAGISSPGTPNHAVIIMLPPFR